MQLSPEKVGRLLRILQNIKSGTQSSRSELKTEALENLLATEVPLQEEPELLNLQEWMYLYRFAGPDTLVTIRFLLNRPDTNLKKIIQIKALSKKLVKSAKNRIESAAARMVYYATIAYAMVYHRCKITSLPDPRLVRSFGRLGHKQWVSKDIANLFQAALLSCSDKMKLD